MINSVTHCWKVQSGLLSALSHPDDGWMTSVGYQARLHFPTGNNMSHLSAKYSLIPPFGEQVIHKSANAFKHTVAPIIIYMNVIVKASHSHGWIEYFKNLVSFETTMHAQLIL